MSLDTKHTRVARAAVAVAALMVFGIIIWYTFRGTGAPPEDERPLRV